jgi:hypothetical protein
MIAPGPDQGLRLHLLTTVKLTMTSLAEPEKVFNRLMKDFLIAEVSSLYFICTPANLALALCPHLDSTS